MNAFAYGALYVPGALTHGNGHAPPLAIAPSATRTPWKSTTAKCATFQRCLHDVSALPVQHTFVYRAKKPMIITTTYIQRVTWQQMDCLFDDS